MKNILILDIGNTMIDSYYQNETNEFFFTIERKGQCDLFLESYLKKIDEYFLNDLSVYISSVNRPAEKRIVDYFTHKQTPIYSLNSLLMEKYIKENNFTINNIAFLGSDLFADIVGSNYKNNKAELVADFGTASKLLLVDQNKTFHGGCIFPGIYSCSKTLSAQTDLLEFTPIKIPANIISLKTDEAINAGALYSAAFTVKGYYEYLKMTYPDLHLYITGGCGGILIEAMKKIRFHDYTFDRFRIIRGIVNAFDIKDKIRGNMIYEKK